MEWQTAQGCGTAPRLGTLWASSMVMLGGGCWAMRCWEPLGGYLVSPALLVLTRHMRNPFLDSPHGVSFFSFLLSLLYSVFFCFLRPFSRACGSRERVPARPSLSLPLTTTRTPPYSLGVSLDPTTGGGVFFRTALARGGGETAQDFSFREVMASPALRPWCHACWRRDMAILLHLATKLVQASGGNDKRAIITELSCPASCCLSFREF